MRIAILALVAALSLGSTANAQNCDGDAQSRAVCRQQQTYERAKQESIRQESERRQAEMERYERNTQGTPPSGSTTLSPGLLPPGSGTLGLTQNEISRSLAYTEALDGISALSVAIYGADVRSYRLTSLAEDHYLRQDLPTMAGDGLTRLQLAVFGALAGLANWDRSEYLAASESQIPPGVRASAESIRRRAIDLLYRCVEWAASADCLRILQTVLQERTEVLPIALPFTKEQLIAAEIREGEHLDWTRLGDLRLRWLNIYGKRQAEARAEAQRAAEDQRAREAEQRTREQQAAAQAAALRAAEKRQAQATLAAAERREAETWHARMTGDRLKTWMALQEDRRNSRLWKDAFPLDQAQRSMLALVSAELAGDAEARAVALRWIAADRGTSLADTDLRKLFPTKGEAEVLADVQAILATTEISDDRLTARIESALSEETRLWRLERRDRMCGALVDSARRFPENRESVIKTTLAISHQCGRYDSDRTIEFLRQLAAAVPPSAVADFWDQLSEQALRAPDLVIFGAATSESARVNDTRSAGSARP